MAAAAAKHVLVTGGNTGIGFALCKQLVLDRGCHVYLGARTLSKGVAAVESIIDAGGAASSIEVVQLDVSDDASVTAAAAALEARAVSLYALVNNAGVGLNTDGGGGLLNTNFYGPVRCSDAFVKLIQPDGGRIVNVSSGSASMWLRGQSPEIKALYSSPDTTWEQLDGSVKLLGDGQPSGGCESEPGALLLPFCASRPPPYLDNFPRDGRLGHRSEREREGG
eukprot:SAG22_NODE_4886_length_1140_cov_1.850144_1_plen_222_part_01